MIDVQAQVSSRVALPVLSRTASVNGATIDLSGFNSLTFVVFTGAVTTADGSNFWTAKLQHGDLADGSDMSDVGIGNFTGSAVINASGQDDVVIGELSYVPMTVAPKRYVRVVLTLTGTSTAVVGAVVLRANARKMPVN